MEQQIAMTRPSFTDEEYHRELWRSKDITVLICQRKTPDLIRLSLESLLSFYPDIPVLIVDGDSQDESVLYLRLKALLNPNVKVWERPHTTGSQHTSHGGTMHEALSDQIKTKYVLILDSDIIVDRGGWIEQMLEQMARCNLYAIGSLMLVSRENEAILGPKDENDVLRYAHPSCSLFDREKYIEISDTYTEWKPTMQKIRNAASDHGSPLVWNMMGAAQLNYAVEYYPVDRYVSHLSGASWQEIPTIWPDGHNVKIRPFVTFIIDKNLPMDGAGWHDQDFDIVTLAWPLDRKLVVHGENPFDLGSFNQTYMRRFEVSGEYVCEIWRTGQLIQGHAIENAKLLCIELEAPDKFIYGGCTFIRRQLWQRRNCLNLS